MVVAAVAWAEAAARKVDEFVKPAFLKSLSKSNTRQLTDDESETFERIKLIVLCQQPYGETVTAQSVRAAMSQYAVPPAVDNLVKTTVSKFTSANGVPPSIDTLRQIRSSAVGLFLCPT